MSCKDLLILSNGIIYLCIFIILLKIIIIKYFNSLKYSRKNSLFEVSICII